MVVLIVSNLSAAILDQDNNERRPPSLVAGADAGSVVAVKTLGRQLIWGRPLNNLPRLVQVKQRGAHAGNKTVTLSQNAVVDKQPTLCRLDRYLPCADLGALPAVSRYHHETMASPVDHIGAFAII